jgi:hypothetical protein
MRFGLKELLVLLYLASGWESVAARLPMLGLSAALLVYAGLYLLLAGALVLTAWIPNHVLRCLYALALAAAAFFDQSVERITSGPLTYDAFINLFDSAGFAGDAFGQFGRPILLAALSSLLLLAAIALPPKRAPALPRLLPAAAPIFATLLLAAILFVRGGEGAGGLPPPWPPLAYSSLLLYETASETAGPVREVAIRPRAPAGHDVVLIVDESVSPLYLDLDDAAGVRSGLAGRRPGVAIFDYGFAASITNCSVGTNVTLRHGGTRADYQSINDNMPTLWDYARTAGLGTVYIDAQRTGGQLQNLMDSKERSKIDAFLQFDRVPVRDRDMAAADALATFLRDGKPELIIVNKVGAHFPVQDKYPDSFMRYRPVAGRGHFEGVADTGSRSGFGGSAEDWRLYRNAYRNTLLWNVGGFFDRLFARADLSNATLVYTSDHGQDLHERGTPGVDTHCSTDPVPEEGLVPLVVVQGAKVGAADFARNVAANRNRSSHYQIFPTLLAAMGYDPSDVRPLYGESLLDRSRDEFTFNTRFNARLGMKPAWKHIDLAGIVAPPRDGEMPARMAADRARPGAAGRM